MRVGRGFLLEAVYIPIHTTPTPKRQDIVYTYTHMPARPPAKQPYIFKHTYTHMPARQAALQPGIQAARTYTHTPASSQSGSPPTTQRAPPYLPGCRGRRPAWGGPRRPRPSHCGGSATSRAGSRSCRLSPPSVRRRCGCVRGIKKVREKRGWVRPPLLSFVLPHPATHQPSQPHNESTPKHHSAGSSLPTPKAPLPQDNNNITAVCAAHAPVAQSRRMGSSTQPSSPARAP